MWRGSLGYCLHVYCLHEVWIGDKKNDGLREGLDAFDGVLEEIIVLMLQQSRRKRVVSRPSSSWQWSA